MNFFKFFNLKIAIGLTLTIPAIYMFSDEEKFNIEIKNNIYYHLDQEINSVTVQNKIYHLNRIKIFLNEDQELNHPKWFLYKIDYNSINSFYDKINKEITFLSNLTEEEKFVFEKLNVNNNFSYSIKNSEIKAFQEYPNSNFNTFLWIVSFLLLLAGLLIIFI